MSALALHLKRIEQVKGDTYPRAPILYTPRGRGERELPNGVGVTDAETAAVAGGVSSGYRSRQ